LPAFAARGRSSVMVGPPRPARRRRSCSSSGRRWTSPTSACTSCGTDAKWGRNVRAVYWTPLPRR